MKLRDWKKLEIHPFALRFREMTPDEFNALKEDIRENGLKEKIHLYRGKVLDGRNRFKACLELDKEGTLPKGSPQFVEFNGDDEAAQKFVTSLNMTRRHLSKSEMAMRLVFDGFVSKPPVDGSRRDYGTGKDAIEQVAKRFGVSHVMLYKAAFVAAHDDKLARDVAKGATSVPVAEKIVREKQAASTSSKKSKQSASIKAAAKAEALFTQCEESLRDANKQLQQLKRSSAILAKDAREIRVLINRVEEILHRCKPGEICPDCQGHGCTKCRRRGWLPRGD